MKKKRFFENVIYFIEENCRDSSLSAQNIHDSFVFSTEESYRVNEVKTLNDKNEKL